MKKTRIAVSLGDPAGISYEITVKAVNSLKNQRVYSLTLFGDKAVFELYKRHIKHSNFEFIPTSDIGKSLKLGLPSKTAGIIAVKAIEAAAKFCLLKKADALVTAPISKESLKFAKVKQPGHTEFLADITKSKEVAMMMVCGKINSVMVSRHIPLSQVAKTLKTDDIVKTVCLAAKQLLITNYKLRNKIAICALNPHAGDNGILGNEEKTIILPAVKKLKKFGLNVDLLPADSAWLKTLNGKSDAAVQKLLLKKTFELERLKNRIGDLNPMRLLESGFAKVRLLLKPDESLHSVTQISTGNRLDVLLKDGVIEAEAVNIKRKK